MKKVIRPGGEFTYTLERRWPEGTFLAYGTTSPSVIIKASSPEEAVETANRALPLENEKHRYIITSVTNF